MQQLVSAVRILRQIEHGKRLIKLINDGVYCFSMLKCEVKDIATVRTIGQKHGCDVYVFSDQILFYNHMYASIQDTINEIDLT